MNKEYKKGLRKKIKDEIQTEIQTDIEGQLTLALDKLEKIKNYKDIGLTLALRIKTNKDISLLKKRLSKGNKK